MDYKNWREWMVFGAWTLGEIVDWYSNLPVYGQIVFIVGILAIITLVFIGVYYLLKGVAYLIYYVLKGVYYLIKGIFFALYKLFELLFRVIAGKPLKKSSDDSTQVVNNTKAEILVKKVINEAHPAMSFCPECGNKLTDQMNKQLSLKGLAFCVHCGKRFRSNQVEIES